MDGLAGLDLVFRLVHLFGVQLGQFRSKSLLTGFAEGIWMRFDETQSL